MDGMPVRLAAPVLQSQAAELVVSSSINAYQEMLTLALLAMSSCGLHDCRHCNHVKVLKSAVVLVRQSTRQVYSLAVQSWMLRSDVLTAMT